MSPIILPFKEKSVRCPDKNFILYTATIEWLMREGISPNDVYVVTKSSVVIDFVHRESRSFGFPVNVLRESDKSTCDLDSSAYAALGLNCKAYYMLSLSSPFRSSGLLKSMASMLSDNFDTYDFVTTYETVTDRSLFYIDEKGQFKRESRHRRGSMCPVERMLDGSAYLIKTDFAKEFISGDTNTVNHSFWSGKFGCVKNYTHFFIDVDTPDDMLRYKLLASK